MSEIGGMSESVENSLEMPVISERAILVERKTVNVTAAKFGQESFNGKAVMFFTGWPFDPSAKATHDFPRALAKEFKSPTFSLGSVASRIEKDTLGLEAKGTYEYMAAELGADIKDIYLVGHSEGTIDVVKLARLYEERRPDIKVHVVLANPMGFYPQSITELGKNFLIVENGLEGKYANPKVAHMPKIDVLTEIGMSILKDVKATGIRYPKMILQQLIELTSFNPEVAELKSPTLVVATEYDPVSQYQKYAPIGEVEKLVADPKSLDHIKAQLEASTRWENMPKKQQDSYGNEEAYINNLLDKYKDPQYLRKFRQQEKLIETGKARTEYVGANSLPAAHETGNVSMMVAERFGSHIGLPVERFAQFAHVISKFFDRNFSTKI